MVDFPTFSAGKKPDINATENPAYIGECKRACCEIKMGYGTDKCLCLHGPSHLGTGASIGISVSRSELGEGALR